jgi:uncharacterized membrane-anchored protein
MQTRHVPNIDRRYWTAIVFASIFGTNLGDFYAHESGLGLGAGLLVLIAGFVAVYIVEARDAVAQEIYYWLAIIIIRTGATNIADYLAFRVRVPPLLLVPGLAAIMAILAWRGAPARVNAATDPAGPAMAATNLFYWGAMLGAGVFGTVLGDICSHHFGRGPASIALLVLFVGLLLTARTNAATRLAVYWCAVALARTAGTCMGDWLAETKSLHVGLALSTLLTCTAFVAILSLWRTAPRAAHTAA